MRATGSYIKGSGGTSNGLTPMLRVFDNTARYVDQGGGKRKGAFAVYNEQWHADIFEFLDLKKVYDAQRDGWTADAFHAGANFMGPCVVICKTASGAVCGGYAPKGFAGASAPAG